MTIDRLNAGDREILVYCNEHTELTEIPVIYLNVYDGDGSKVWEKLQQIGAENGDGTDDLVLVVLSGMNWNADMSPWPMAPMFFGEDIYSGHAEHYLNWMIDVVMPHVDRIIMNRLGVSPAWNGLAGYSLAGLFAYYSAYLTDRFARFASVSGSLWYPKLLEFAESHEFAMQHGLSGGPEAIYFSVGDKEKKTRNQLMQAVEENTQRLYEAAQDKKIDSVFQLNSGNHFKDPDGRTATAIQWLVSRS